HSTALGGFQCCARLIQPQARLLDRRPVAAEAGLRQDGPDVAVEAQVVGRLDRERGQPNRGENSGGPDQGRSHGGGSIDFERSGRRDGETASVAAGEATARRRPNSRKRYTSF